MDGIQGALESIRRDHPDDGAIAWHRGSSGRIVLVGPAKGENVSDFDRSDIAKRLAAQLDAGRQQSMSRQIVDHVWLEVLEGTLQTGEQMPTVRQLSIDLGLTPRAIERAFQQLEQLGVLSTHSGEGTYVSLNAPDGAIRERWVKLEKLCRDAVYRAGTLGFSIDDLLDALVDLRTTNNDLKDSERYR